MEMETEPWKHPQGPWALAITRLSLRAFYLMEAGLSVSAHRELEGSGTSFQETLLAIDYSRSLC